MCRVRVCKEWNFQERGKRAVLSRAFEVARGSNVARDSNDDHDRANASKPMQVFNSLAGHVDVHTPETRDDVHGHDDGTESGKLGQHVIDLIVGIRHLNRDLGEVVGV